MSIKPWYTSYDIIDSVKRKIAFPISQNTFTNLDILAFANEEMFISQVPTILQFHEEYFVNYVTTPLKTNLSKYPIPGRATGMKLRDLFWMDQNGNLFEMTRIEEHDKAFFQANIGSNQAIHKFYIEGNDVVLTPGVVDSPTGSLVFVFYLRPNQLVKNDRAAIVQGFNQPIRINNSLIVPLDTITLGKTIYTAVNTLGGSISSITALSSTATQIASANHQLSTGQFVTITGSNSNPIIDGTYCVTVLDPNNFTIPFQIATSGSTGTFTSTNQFQIAVSDALTAANLSASINATAIDYTTSTNSLNLVIPFFLNIRMPIITSNTIAFMIPQHTIGIVFDSLPSVYTDNETNITEPLFQPNTLIDFLQTEPGHRIYKYDVLISPTGISGTTITFQQKQLLVPTGTINNGITKDIHSNPIQFILADIKPNDYICLANEAIIPQIPPDLHNGLAERTAARILAAIGDQAGLATSNAKIAEIEQRQGNLLDNRSEGTPQKVNNRHSLLRYGKLGTTRRT